MRIPKEEYNKARECLKKYSYHCRYILDRRNDIMQLSGVNMDGMPHSKYTISDIVANSVILLDLLDEEPSIKESFEKYSIVQIALELVDADTKAIFTHLYEKKDMGKYQIIDEIHISEDTFKNKHRKLVYAVYETMKKYEAMSKALKKNKK